MASTSDFIIYGETPSVHTLRATILGIENTKLDVLAAGFKLAASNTDVTDLKRSMQSLYMQSRECIERANREGIDLAFKEETKAHVEKVMNEAAKALNLPPIANIMTSDAFSHTETLYGGQEAYQNAVETGETELTYDEWVAVRTSDFKENIVDWQAIQNKEYLLSAPEVVADNNDAPDTKDIEEIEEIEEIAAWASTYFSGDNRIFHKEIGDIEIDQNSLKESLARGQSAEKVQVLSVLHKALPKAQILHRESKKKNQRGYVLGVPVKVNGKDYIATAIIKREAQRNRLQLHHIELREQLLAEISTAKKEVVSKTMSANESDSTDYSDDKYGVVTAITHKALSASDSDVLLINSKTKEPSSACLKKLHQVPSKKLVANFEHYSKKLQQEIKSSETARYAVDLGIG